MPKPKRKKYPKLPNGYGSIKYLGKGRRNPYAVHPPTTEFNLDGSPRTPKALCYVDEWLKGFTVLTAYKAGKYYPGYENTLFELNTKDTDKICKTILADYNQFKGIPQDTKGKTFSEIYDDYYKWKYEDDKSKKYSKSAMNSTRAAYKNCAVLHDKVFEDLRHNDLQSVLDRCPLKYSSLELIVSLLHQMYSYADIYELVEKDYSSHIKINKPDDDESGIPFSDDELKKLWENKYDKTVEFILIMCYSGYRIRAYYTLEVNVIDEYFKGGIKTAASKNRIVPIHSGITPIVNNRLERYGKLLPAEYNQFRKDMEDVLKNLKISPHTPHDCRHTFSSLCEKYGVNENDRKRMLGHSFGSDITNSTYGHRSIEDLKSEIEKIKICY